uniref:Uncharacterized protein n=1 Tax=Amphimedon queenslandica TaxID=400682 RepID=A0A1X7SN79_AMPQE
MKFNMTLFGYDYFGSKTPTDGTVQIYNDANFLLNQTYIPNTCSLIEYTPKLIHKEYQSYINLAYSFLFNIIILYFIVKECPIGFRLDKFPVLAIKVFQERM